MSDPTAGEIGGIFAGLVGLLVALGHGVKYLMGWEERRDQSRSDKLNAWHKELDAREAKVDAEMAAQHAEARRQYAELKARDEQREREHGALHTAYQLIAAALRQSDPGNPALRMADELLRIAFPPDPVTPPAFAHLIAEIDQNEVDPSK